MSEKPDRLLTATQAAQAAGVSRWAVHRAIKSMVLKAVRDNRNIWRIAPDDLEAWCAATVAQPLRAQETAQAEGLAELRGKLAEAELRAAVADARADASDRARAAAEAQAEAWRAMAEKLAARRRWWPFG